MSELSYQYNVDRGVTGPWSSTCLLASYDRISEYTGIQPWTYERYDDLRNQYVKVCGDDTNFVTKDIVQQFKEIKVNFRAELGVYTAKNIVGTQAKSVDDLRGVLGRLTTGGYRPAVYLDTGGAARGRRRATRW